MVRLLVICLCLSGCQLIINHNEFAAPADASGDGALPDVQQVDDQVKSPAGTRVRFASALVLANDGSAPTHVDDGDWIQNVTRPMDDLYLVTLKSGFSEAPRCVCTSTGGNNHGCTLKQAPEAREVQVTIWPDPQSNAGVNRTSFYLTCVGGSETSEPAGAVESPSTGNTMLATAHLIPNGVDAEDGNWIEGVSSPDLKASLVAGTFSIAPNCSCRTVGTGAFGCLLDPLTSTALVPARGWQEGDVIGSPGSSQGAYVMCSGPTNASKAPGSVRSPSTSPMLLASARVGVDGAILAQDGAWATAVHSGPGHYSLSMSGFSAAPVCTCSAISGGQAQCTPRAITQPDSLAIEIWAEPNSAPLLDTGFDVLCVGARL